MRKIISVVAGVIAGIIVVFVGDAIVHALYPVPLGMNYMDKNMVLDYVKNIPQYILILMAATWLVSSFCGGLIAALIMRSNWKKAGLSVGSILMVTTLFNLLMTVPAHPTWMWVTALVGQIPAAFIGAWLFGRKNPTDINQGAS